MTTGKVKVGMLPSKKTDRKKFKQSYFLQSCLIKTKFVDNNLQLRSILKVFYHIRVSYQSTYRTVGRCPQRCPWSWRTRTCTSRCQFGWSSSRPTSCAPCTSSVSLQWTSSTWEQWNKYLTYCYITGCQR